MPPLSRHPRRLAFSAAALFCAASIGASVLSAAAASLGGVDTGQLVAYSGDVSIDVPDPPGPLISTDFTGCSNFIDGWVDESGNTWTSHSGNWQCLGAGVARAQQRVPFANLTVGITQSTGIRITTQVSDISHQNNRSGPGLSLLGDGEGNFVYVVYERDEARLTIASTDGTVFGTVNDLPDRDSATIVAELEGTGFTVYLDGQSFGPFYLDQNDPLLGNSEFGLISDNDNQSRFDSFTIELLP